MGNPIMTALRRATCPPWCVNHDDEHGICYGETIPTPGSEFNAPSSIGLSFDHEAGVVVAIGDTHMPYAAARSFALALVRQLDQARAAMPLPLEALR